MKKEMKKPKDYEKIIDAVEQLSGFTIKILDIVTIDGQFCADLNQWTPQGEDWCWSVWFDGTYEDFVGAVCEYAVDFDVDEEAAGYIEYRGSKGIPCSVRDILEDQEWKKEQLGLLGAEL